MCSDQKLKLLNFYLKNEKASAESTFRREISRNYHDLSLDEKFDDWLTNARRQGTPELRRALLALFKGISIDTDIHKSTDMVDINLSELCRFMQFCRENGFSFHHIRQMLLMLMAVCRENRQAEPGDLGKKELFYSMVKRSGSVKVLNTMKTYWIYKNKTDILRSLWIINKERI